MTHSNRVHAVSLRAVRGFVSVLVLAATTSACALMNTGQAEVVGTLYQADRTYVRIERIGAGAASNNAHPFAVSAEAIHNAFANLKVSGSVSTDPTPVFTAEGLKEIVPHVAAALAKAGPTEDVTFAVTGEHGFFGKYSPRDVTTGRVFVAQGQLNIIFGNMHERYEFDKPGQIIKPGSREQRIESGWNLVAGVARLKDKRTDWALFDVASLTAIAPPAPQPQKTGTAPTADAPAVAPTAPAGVPGRYQELEDKLRTLDRLKASGLITDEEYREKRRALLQQL